MENLRNQEGNDKPEQEENNENTPEKPHPSHSELAQNDEQSKLEKQHMIDQEILQKGFEPQDFYFYLQNLKNIGQDLNSWSRQELKEAIQEFQDFQFAQSLQNEEEKDHQNQSRLLFNMQLQQNPKVTPQGHPVIDQDRVQHIMPLLNPYEHGPFLQVTQLKPTILNNNIKFLKIQVDVPQIVKTTELLFIETKSLLFTIRTTKPVKWEVQRTEKDFYTIKKLLQLQFPHLLIPPLPNGMEFKYTKKSLEKRRNYFQRFLKAVCRSEELCTYQILVEFLMIKHNYMKTFQEKMKQEEMVLSKQRQLTKPEVEQLSSMYEKVYTNLIPIATSFNVPMFIEHFEDISKEMIKGSKQVKEKSDSLSQSYLKFQEILMKLSQHQSELSIPQLIVFANLSKIIGSDAFIMQQQGETILKAMKYLKYNVEFVNSMKELQIKSEYTKQKFLKAEKQFLDKREKVINQLGQSNQSQVSQTLIDRLLPVETKELEKSNQFMNFFTNQTLHEVRRMQFEMEFEGMKDNFEEMTKSITTGLNQRNVYWSGMINALDKIEDE